MRRRRRLKVPSASDAPEPGSGAVPSPSAGAVSSERERNAPQAVGATTESRVARSVQGSSPSEQPEDKQHKEIAPLQALMLTAYLAAPFLYEMRSILDWCLASTSLSLSEWIRFDQIHLNLFQNQAGAESAQNPDS